MNTIGTGEHSAVGLSMGLDKPATGAGFFWLAHQSPGPSTTADDPSSTKDEPKKPFTSLPCASGTGGENPYIDAQDG
jgi:hypothetical protein